MIPYVLSEAVMGTTYAGLALAVIAPAVLVSLSLKGSTTVQNRLMQLAQSRAAQRLATIYTQGKVQKLLFVCVDHPPATFH